VLGSLPIALAARGHRVMVVVPRYANYEEPIDTGVSDTAGCVSPSAAQKRPPAAVQRESCHQLAVGGQLVLPGAGILIWTLPC